MKDVRNLIGKIEYTRFGDWKKFGGLVFTPEHNDDEGTKGLYGLNMERCGSFFKGFYKIPMKVLKNPVTGEITGIDYKTIREVPSLSSLMDSGEYEAWYRENPMIQTHIP